MFIQNLRSATAEYHKKLEQNHLSIALLSNTVTEGIYAQYLEKLYPFVIGFEQYIFPLLKDYLQDIENRKKAHLIENDLKNFGINVKRINKLSNQFFDQQYPGFYEAMGGMYVLEGSTLGGQIIQKHLLKVLGSAFKGSHYFAAYRHNTGTYWKSFLKQLSDTPKTIFQEQQIIGSAIKTFSFINEQLIYQNQISTQYVHKEHC